MSDVREQVGTLISRVYGGDNRLDGVMDAILERFEVTPKPVITDCDLGRLVALVKDLGLETDTKIGERLSYELRMKGLKIVKVSDGS